LLSKGDGLYREVLIGEILHLRLEVVDRSDQRTHLLDVALMLGAKNLGENFVHTHGETSLNFCFYWERKERAGGFSSEAVFADGGARGCLLPEHWTPSKGSGAAALLRVSGQLETTFAHARWLPWNPRREACELPNAGGRLGCFSLGADANR